MIRTGSMMGILCASVVVAGCGGSSKSPRQAEAPVAMNESLPDEEQPTAIDEDPAAEAAASADAAPPEPVEPAKPPPVVAIADMLAAKDDAVMGAVTFELGDDGTITIAGQFTGLTPGKHAFYVHEQGDCSGKGKKIGTHLNPTKAKHGPPASSVRHAGDFGNLEADADGNAMFSMTTDSVTLVADRPDSVLNRSIVIHAKADDKKGSGGAVVACGVINLRP